jgi:hypothetical protein
MTIGWSLLQVHIRVKKKTFIEPIQESRANRWWVGQTGFSVAETFAARESDVRLADARGLGRSLSCGGGHLFAGIRVLPVFGEGSGFIELASVGCWPGCAGGFFGKLRVVPGDDVCHCLL